MPVQGRAPCDSFAYREVVVVVEAVIWLVVWVILAFAGVWLSVALFGLAGMALVAGTNAMWVAPVAVVVGWLVAVGWFIFAIIHAVLQVIDVVQLATA